LSWATNKTIQTNWTRMNADLQDSGWRIAGKKSALLGLPKGCFVGPGAASSLRDLHLYPLILIDRALCS